VWEVRVALGPDPVSGVSRRRSITIHGDEAVAEEARRHFAEEADRLRTRLGLCPGVTVGELLTVWLGSDHGWRPSTVSGYRSIVRFLAHDWIAGRRAVEVSPVVVRAACTAWREAGRAQPTVAGWVRCLRSAFGWAHTEGILDHNPLDGMRGPAQPGVRLHAPVDEVRAVLTKAENDVAAAGVGGRAPAGSARLHKAEQVLLLARLVADSGARRGELAALQIGDLDDDVLTITRATSNEIVGATKTGRTRRLTLGRTTAGLWRSTVQTWRGRAGPGRFGPWLFSSRPDHTTRLTTSCAGHWFTELTASAGHADITLHRLRHSVATILVGRGDLLQAQHRLGHRDASTTLRIYAHAMPLTDADAAEALDSLYREGSRYVV
jgi:integrase